MPYAAALVGDEWDRSRDAALVSYKTEMDPVAPYETTLATVSAGVTVQQPSDGDTSQSAAHRMLCTSAKSAAQMEAAPVNWFTSNRSAVVAVFRTEESGTLAILPENYP